MGQGSLSKTDSPIPMAIDAGKKIVENRLVTLEAFLLFFTRSTTTRPASASTTRLKSPPNWPPGPRQNSIARPTRSLKPPLASPPAPLTLVVRHQSIPSAMRSPSQPPDKRRI